MVLLQALHVERLRGKENVPIDILAIFPYPCHSGLSCDVPAGLPGMMASSYLPDSNYALLQEDYLLILLSTKERLFSCNPATDAHEHILTHLYAHTDTSHAGNSPSFVTTS